MNGALTTLHLIEATTGILLALLLRTLYRRFSHQEHLRYWAWSWLVMAAALFGSVPIFFMDHPELHLRTVIPLVMVASLVGNFRAPLIALAALSLRPTPPGMVAQRLWLAGGLLISIAEFLIIAASGAHDFFSIVKYLVLPTAFVGIALAWYTLASIRYPSRFSTTARAVTILFCFALAVHEFVFGISRFGLNIYTDQNLMLASLMGAFLPLGITFGLVMTVVAEAVGVEHQFGRVWEASLDGMCLIDGGGMITKVNEAFCRLLNCQRTGLEGKPFTSIYNLGDADRLLEEYGRFFAASQPVTRQITEMRREDGSVMWLDVSAAFIESAHQKMLLSVVRDVTVAQRAEAEQKRSEEALRDSEKRYRLLAENATDVIWTMDLNLRRTFISPSVTQARGLTVEEALEQSPEEAFAPDSLSLFRKVCQEELDLANQKGADPYRYRTLEIELRRKDGSTYWAETRISLLRDPAGRAIGFLGVTRDISERRQSEATRKKLEAQIRQSQKMEAIGTFAGGIAHDFNNILTIIGGFTELAIRTEVMSPEELRQTLTPVLAATNRAKDLVKQILTFSRMGEQERKPIRLDLLIKEALKFLRASIPSTIEIEFSSSSEPLIAMADPTQVHQIVMNLCANAFHAMRDKENGRLDIKLIRDSIESHSIDDFGEEVKAGEYARFTFEDNGPGIHPQIINRIFEPFFTTKPKGEGTGLGLSVVHGIVKSHGGFIRTFSRMGHGATFEVFLPVLEVAEVEEAEKSHPALPRGSGERILVVDDEANIVDVHRMFLERLGYKVTTEADSLKALEIFRQEPDSYHAVITDQTMPNQTGLNLAAEIMKIRQDIPIILCTGYSDQISVEKIKECGIRELLSKPARLQEVAGVLARVLASHRQKTVTGG